MELVTAGPEARAPGSLLAAARSGSRWTAVQFGGARLATVLVFLVLARLLSPESFGVVAIATVFVALLQILVEGGFSLALIQREHLERGHVDTVFWTSVATGFLLSGGLALVAAPLAAAYDEPQLAEIIPVLAIGLFVSALGSTQSAQLRRQLRFRPLAVRAVASSALAGVVGIVLALTGFGVWALVVQYVVLNLVQTTALWLSTSWRPGLAVSRRHFGEVFHFSRHSLGNTLLQFTVNRSDDFFIGVFLGPASLGLYSVAYRLLSSLNDVINQMLLGVAFPVFSRLQNDRARLQRAYCAVLKVGAALAFPSYLFFVVGAPEVVEVFFGRQWEAAAPVMAVLALFGAVQTPVMITDSCLNAIGRPQVVFRHRLVGTVVQLVAFAVAASFGIIWVAWALVVRAYLLAPLPVLSLMRAGVVDVRTWSRSFLAPLLATAAMLLATWGVRAALETHASAPVRLIAMLAVAPTVYLGALVLLDRPLVRELFGMVRARKRRRRLRSGGDFADRPVRDVVPSRVAADG